MKAFVPLVLLGALSAAACAPRADKPAFNAARAVDAIRTGEVNWNADWKSGDAGKIAAHFAPDAVVMLPDSAPTTGLEAIRTLAQKNMDDPGFTFAFSSDKVDVATSGDLAVSRGSFTETSTDPDTKKPAAVTGSFVTVYKPEADGTWKAVWDIATPGPPAAVIK
jgi:uncharacterized protein (TIGR02246 family)